MEKNRHEIGRKFLTTDTDEHEQNDSRLDVSQSFKVTCCLKAFSAFSHHNKPTYYFQPQYFIHIHSGVADHHSWIKQEIVSYTPDNTTNKKDTNKPEVQCREVMQSFTHDQINKTIVLQLLMEQEPNWNQQGRMQNKCQNVPPPPPQLKEEAVHLHSGRTAVDQTDATSLQSNSACWNKNIPRWAECLHTKMWEVCD